MTPERMAAMEAAAVALDEADLTRRRPPLHPRASGCSLAPAAPAASVGRRRSRVRTGSHGPRDADASSDGPQRYETAAYPSATLGQLTTFHHASR